MPGGARAAVIATLVAAGIGGCGDSTPAVQERPNIVVVMTDDQDLASLDVMSGVRRLLVRRGVSFERSYASFPLCCPSRATLVTGQYAHNHGVASNDPPNGGYLALTDRRATLGVWLQAAGYRTAWIGKFLNGWGLDGHYRIPPGWSDWEVPVEESYLRMYGYVLDRNGELVGYGSRPADYQTDVLAERARAFIRRSAGTGSPFFLMLAPLAPHHEADYLDTGSRDPRPAPRHLGRFAGTPLPHPPSFNERDVRDKPRSLRRRRLDAVARNALHRSFIGRLESLLAVDEAVVDLVRTLRDVGELAHTTIVFTSDNGYLLGEHRLVGKPPALYEEEARVPLIIRGPGFGRGQRVRAPVANVDLTATIADLAAAATTRALDGLSLVEVGGDPQAWRDRLILLEHKGGIAGLRAGPYAYYDPGAGERELYDLRADPYQLTNLAGSSRTTGVETALAAQLSRLRACGGEECIARLRPLP